MPRIAVFVSPWEFLRALPGKMLFLCLNYNSNHAYFISKTTGAINFAISNPRCSFDDFKDEIEDLDSNIPIMDMIQNPFIDLGNGGDDEMHIDIWNQTLRILLENNILDFSRRRRKIKIARCSRRR